MEESNALPDSVADGDAAMVVNQPAGGETAERHACIQAISFKVSLCLSYTLAVLVVAFDFWAQVNGKPYIVHDWVIGIIASPLFGWVIKLKSKEKTSD